jgi:hypothetical protein
VKGLILSTGTYKIEFSNSSLLIMIIRNYATNLIFFAQLAGRPAKARQADDVPIAIGRSTSNASVHHTVSCFLIFTGAIADVHTFNILKNIPLTRKKTDKTVWINN